ncbi:MAG TPA: maleylpyruvate isomerase family mycothiol-dependent enzyme [Candidatus Dormibacteraeota bacterium]|jgi:uncharacterized protein (TIGR03083 family)|nr:maleylpyruvate isomerase family mycothiol-dependent enzyme [Candidatus Dormibacteraeota bacterium]
MQEGGRALAALGEELERLQPVLLGLQEDDLRRTTNCPPWSIQELVVHIADSIRLVGPLAPGDAGAALHSAADYYRRPERGTAAYRQSNVHRMRLLASEVLMTTSSTAWLDTVAASTLATLGAQDPESIVLVPRIGSMRLDDWIATRVISVAIHGIDVAITLGLESWTSASARRVTHDVLVDLLGEDPPPPLGWGLDDLLLAGTGRRTLTDTEREVLGAAASRFPLLS